MSFTVSVVFDSAEPANDALEALIASGVDLEDIGVVARDGAEVAVYRDGATKPEATAAGAGAGAALGAALALALAAPGGMLLAGPIGVALGGAAAGAWTGGLVGALVDIGVDQDRARVLMQGVDDGGVLVAVDAPDARQASAVEHLLRTVGGPLTDNTLHVQRHDRPRTGTGVAGRPSEPDGVRTQ